MTIENIMIGFFFGFALGAGSSLAVILGIAMNSHRDLLTSSRMFDSFITGR